MKWFDKTPALVVGAGGHGVVVADILRTSGREVVGFIDDDPALAGEKIIGISVIGSLPDTLRLARASGAQAIVGLSDNIQRGRLFRRLIELGVPTTHAIHPTAIIGADVTVDSGVVIMPGAVVNTRVCLDFGSIVNTSATVDHDCTLGCMAQAMPGAILAGGITVERYATIGAGAIVLPRKRIGVNAFVGAGAVVTRDVPDDTIVVGVPARFLKNRPPLPPDILNG